MARSAVFPEDDMYTTRVAPLRLYQRRNRKRSLMACVLVHEWIAQDGGSENVLQAMSETFPDAELRCLRKDSRGRFDPRRVRDSWLARMPLRRQKAVALPLMPATRRSPRYHGYDRAVISSHAFGPPRVLPGCAERVPADGVRPHASPVHVDAGVRRARQHRCPTVSHVLRPPDRRPAHEGAELFTPGRRQEDPGRARVARRAPAGRAALLDELPDGFVLGASRFIPYKRPEDVIKLGEATGRPVVLAGKGPHLAELQAAANAASVPVHFVHAPSDSLLYAPYQRTALFVFPAVEDFGIRTPRAVCDRNELDPSRRSPRGDLPFTNNQTERLNTTSPRSTMLQDRVARPLIPAGPRGRTCVRGPG